MTFRKFIFFVLISFAYFYPCNELSAQAMNTSKWRRTEKDSLDNALLLFDEKNYLMALPIFENIQNHHPKEDFIKYAYGKCCLYRSDKHEEAYTLLSEVYAKNKKILDIQFDLAQAAHYTNKFDEALTYVDAYLINKKTQPEGKKSGELLKRYINNAKYYVAKPTNAKITNLGAVVNNPDNEYVPTITADEDILVFTYSGEKSKGGRMNAYLQPDKNGQYFEDIYMTVKINDEFGKPFALDSINTNGHDAAISLSHDGNILFIYRDNGDDHGDIYLSNLIGINFTKPAKIKGQVNSYSWDGHCSLSPDGQMLYFSSERGGGYGGRDIYRAMLMPDSTWGNVKNLGDSINTPYNDDAPFIHPDGVTLYYSSEGRTSMGGYDIFRSTMNLQDSTFKKTEHLGYPINSTGDDRYFVLAANGKTGYYSSGKKGGQGLSDLYKIETNFEGAKPALYLVKGKTTKNGQNVEAKIIIEVTSKDNKVYKTIKSNGINGQYLVVLPPGSTYKIKYIFDNFEYKNIDVDATKLTEYTEQVVDINFDTPQADTVKTIVTPTVAVVSPTKTVVKDDFVPRNKLQAKIMVFVEKYGDISAEGLDFRVQIAAYKFPKNYTYKHLKGLGKVENLLLEDGITRITIGGVFNTIRKAFEHNKKVVIAGQTDAFVTALYKGKRVYLEDLEKMGIFK
ncbi:MAG: hypothetical protein SFY56_03255 [Bacteroidota bacterium]|nr:hypothetical protein [Bacteroidota bacterium]